MSWNKWIRQLHRWFSIAFTLAMVVNGIAVFAGKYNNTFGILAVAPMIPLFLTGAWLFLLPYAVRVRQRRTAH